MDMLLVPQGTFVVGSVCGSGRGQMGPCKLRFPASYLRLGIGATQLCASEAWKPQVLENVLDTPLMSRLQQPTPVLLFRLLACFIRPT